MAPQKNFATRSSSSEIEGVRSIMTQSFDASSADASTSSAESSESSSSAASDLDNATVYFQSYDGEEEDGEEDKEYNNQDVDYEDMMYVEDFDKDYSENDQEQPPLASEPRLDSFDCYIVVSVLTATASFAALLDDKPDGDKSLTHRPLARNIAILICAICSLSGIYSTVVFSFSSIYGRTAIGMGRYDAYESFLSQTASMRKKGFYMYLLSLVLFIVLLIIAAVDKIDDEFETPFVVFLVLTSLYIYRDWSQIITAAGAIFAPDPKSSTNQNRRHGMTLRSHCRTEQKGAKVKQS